jgi:hypothetical protein
LKLAWGSMGSFGSALNGTPDCVVLYSPSGQTVDSSPFKCNKKRAISYNWGRWVALAALYIQSIDLICTVHRFEPELHWSCIFYLRIFILKWIQWLETRCSQCKGQEVGFGSAVFGRLRLVWGLAKEVIYTFGRTVKLVSTQNMIS